MRLLKIAIILLLGFCYLAFSYIRFYHIIGDANLKSPYIEKTVLIENVKGKSFVKYVALGDSLSAGVGAGKINETFPYQYAVKLSQKYGNITLTNLAQPGGETRDVINNQLSVAISEKPNYITLLIGTNDVHNKLTLKDFRERYFYILNELISNTDAQITVMTIPYLGSSVSVYFPFNFALDFRTKQFNKVIQGVVNEVGESKRVRLLDLYTKTRTFSDLGSSYYSSDYFHPSGEGYLLWSKLINAD